MGRNRMGGSGDRTLISERLGFNPPPPPKQSYLEAELNGRRGRVIYQTTTDVIIKLYASGDQETVPREKVRISERHP